MTIPQTSFTCCWGRCTARAQTSATIQVLRRASYKGGVSNECALPVDAASVMGIVLVLGSVLGGTALPLSTAGACCEILASMEEKVDLPKQFVLIPGNRGQFSLDIQDNKIEASALRSMLRNLDIPWSRIGGCRQSYLSVHNQYG